MNGQFRLGPEYSGREGIPIRGYIKIVQREGNEQPWKAPMTNSAATRSEETSWKISVWILSGNSHAAQPAERRRGSEDRVGDSYEAKAYVLILMSNNHLGREA